MSAGIINIITDNTFLLKNQAWKGFFAGVENPIDQIFLFVFVLIGLFMFAREAPKFIFEALGIKNKGNFMKMLSMGAAALGSAGTVASSFRARQANDRVNGERHALRNIGASLFGGAAGLSSAGSAILSTDKPTIRTGFDAQQQYNARNLGRIAKGSTAAGRAGSVLSSIFTGRSSAEKFQLRIDELKSANEAIGNYKKAIESRFDGDDKFELEYNGHRFNWLNFTRTFEAAQGGDAGAIQSLTTMTGLNMDEIRQQYDTIHKTGYSNFAEATRRGDAHSDSVAYGAFLKMKDAVKGIEVDQYLSNGKRDNSKPSVQLSNFLNGEYDNTKKGMGNVSGTQRDVELDPDYKAAMADSSEVKKK